MLTKLKSQLFLKKHQTVEKNPTNLLSNENYIFYALKRKTIKKVKTKYKSKLLYWNGKSIQL